MQIEIAAIRSRVGRRIFLLFICCSLIPIVLMSYVAFHQVSTALLAASRHRTAAAIKNYEMEVLGDMDSLDSDLRILSQEKLAASEISDTVISAHWKSIQYRELPTEWDGVIDGTLLGPEQRRHLETGNSVVAVVGNPPAVTMFHYARLGTPRRALLVGRVNPSFLFGGNYAPGEGEVLIQEKNGRVIYRSDGNMGPASETPAGNSQLTGFERNIEDRRYESIRQDMFLRAKYSADSWRIEFRHNLADVLVPIQGFRTSFPLILLLGIWMVLLLSAIQIRRTTAPLLRLRDAVAEFGNLNYAPVRIAAKDEFGELADAFNRMQQRLCEQFKELDDFNWGTLRALARAIDAKSRWTAGHSERVTEIGVRIAEIMKLPSEDVMTLRRGGLVHDIGKIGTPVEILDKPGKLSDAEMKVMRDHVTVGASILEPIPAFKSLLPIVAEHHERFDGLGYPRGLSGNEISLHARILTVADFYDALISDRPYRAGLPKEQVVRMIVEASGKQFDPKVVEAFLMLLKLEKDGLEFRLPRKATEGEWNAADENVVADSGTDFLPGMPPIGYGANGTNRNMADGSHWV